MPTPTEMNSFSLHDALPISRRRPVRPRRLRHEPRRPGEAAARAAAAPRRRADVPGLDRLGGRGRSEEHTSELQSRRELVCRLLLEKKENHLMTVKNNL